MIRRFVVPTCALLIASLCASSALAAPPAGRPYELNAVVPLTGGGAFLGRSYQDTFRALENVVNAAGGINGRPLKIVSLDSQTSAQVGVQLVNDLIAKHANVIIDGDPAAVCNAQAPIVNKNGPVLYCLSPLIYPAAGSYVFSSSASGTVLATVGLRYFRLRKWKRVAMISSTDSTGADFDNQTLAALALPENKDMQLVAREHFNPADLTVSAQLARIKAADPQAIFVWTTGTPVATVFRALQESGMNVPVATSQANLVYEQLDSYAGFLPKQLYFPTVLALTPGASQHGPLHDAQTRYAAAFKALGVKPDLAHNLPWDPSMIIIDALRHVGADAAPDRIRDYILHLHGWVGVDGVYDFGSGDQRGIGESAAAVARWDFARGTWVQASSPRGYLVVGEVKS
jgi:branched-chain amino acid transport system substrate-binding protein